MKTIPALVLAAILGVGLLAGVTTYQLASGTDGTGAPAASPSAEATPVARTHRPRVRWAPCKPPSVRRGKACVTEEVRTVVVPAPASPAAPAAPAAPVVQAVRSHDGDRGEHAGEDRGSEPEHESEDREDDGGEHESEDD